MRYFVVVLRSTSVLPINIIDTSFGSQRMNRGGGGGGNKETNCLTFLYLPSTLCQHGQL